MLGDTGAGFIRLMIIKPKPDQQSTDALGKDWVSDEWLRLQTDRPSTHGWYDLVTKRVKEMSHSKIRINATTGQVWWKRDHVMRVLKEDL